MAVGFTTVLVGFAVALAAGFAAGF